MALAIRKKESELSPGQAIALRKMLDWYKDRRKHKRPFLMTGQAGTGKSFLIDRFIQESGLRPHRKGSPGFLSATFTGKAALVLKRAGVENATTIHRITYRYVEPSEAEFARLDRELGAAERAVAKAGGDYRDLMAAKAAGIKRQIVSLTKPKFVLNYSSEAANAKLIILDEVSMVGEQMAKDLLSVARGVPILVVGDPGQLPPIKGLGYFTEREPDATLTEIHRQAEGNPIIELSRRARLGERITIGEYGSGVTVRPRKEIDPKWLLRFDQVLCGTNATRRSLNMDMLRAEGFNSPIPTGNGEKIICLRNEHEHGLVNGMFLEMTRVRKNTPISLSAVIRDVDDHEFRSKDFSVYTGFFEDHLGLDKNRDNRDRKAKRDLVWADLGYVLTVHKAQGSGFESVAVIDDGFDMWKEDAIRMRYTAITRAAKELTIYV